MTPSSLIFLAGIGQIGLIIGSLWLPKFLNFREETAKVSPLIGQMFWNYSAYTWATNLFFALISVLNPAALLDGSFLAIWVSGFITVYWLGRIIVQYFYFDKSGAPAGWFFKVSEYGLEALFFFLTIAYGWAFLINLNDKHSYKLCRMI